MILQKTVLYNNFTVGGIKKLRMQKKYLDVGADKIIPQYWRN